ncbi:hypothetical protein [Egicoccus sp. AB-alg6-2]|uniref:hypothetical protein n=1 Tax=Egicoccus sp. AB-alg6-2 TaxID=3242692 RepID=UPI00359EB6AA
MATTATRAAPPSTRRRPVDTSTGRPLPLAYSLLLGAILLLATSYGLLIEGAYRAPDGVRPTLPETLRGQDLVTLLATAALVWGALRARAGSLRGHIVWLAVCLYVAYTYLMYVVAPYNDALLLYIAAIGLATYGFVNGLVRLQPAATADAFTALPRRGLAWFLFVVAGLFATLWLTDILAVWPGGVPDSLFTYDIPSIVHVLDLGIVLPLLVLTGVLLLREHPVAPVLAAIVLVKTLTLGLALLSMNAFVAVSGAPVDAGEPMVWSAIVTVCLAWLVVGARRMRAVSSPWLRPGVWSG